MIYGIVIKKQQFILIVSVMYWPHKMYRTRAIFMIIFLSDYILHIQF